MGGYFFAASSTSISTDSRPDRARGRGLLRRGEAKSHKELPGCDCEVLVSWVLATAIVILTPPNTPLLFQSAPVATRHSSMTGQFFLVCGKSARLRSIEPRAITPLQVYS